jgi:hypothetical protein
VSDPTSERSDIARFASYVNMVRSLLSQANNIWGETYVLNGGPKNDAVACEAADRAMTVWLRDHKHWAEAKQVMLRVVKLDEKLSMSI